MILDVSAVPHHCCNHGIDALHKAMAEEPDEAGIWLPHDNPWLADLCERVTAEGQAQLLDAQTALFAALGIGAASGPILAKATHWSRQQIEQAAQRLQKPLDTYTPSDWVLLVDTIIQTRLAPASLVDAFTWRAQLAGRLDALHRLQPDIAPHEALLALVIRANTTHPPARLPWLQRAWEWAKARVGVLIVQLSDNLRARLAGTIVTHIEAHGTTDRGLLEQQLRDVFGAANRDWRRIAVTEATEAANTAYLQSLPSGAVVERIEQYATACAFCKSIHGQTFTWSTVPLGNEHGWTHVWPGKTNVGRSNAPRKRTAEGLVERTESELWWPASGAMHPHCFIDPNLPIYTADGWRPISGICVGDQVLTHLGRFRAVNWVLDDAPPYTGQVVTLRVSAAGKNAVSVSPMTPEHPVYTERGWVPAGQVMVGDQIVTLARKCPTCGQVFVNPKFTDVVHCSNRCVPKSGVNQYSTDDPEVYAREVERTRASMTARMRGMTVEQRRALTAAGRAVMAARGYDHLQAPESRSKGGMAAASNNYAPSPTETEIARYLKIMGADVATQFRVQSSYRDTMGRRRYWWIDLAIPSAKIAVEIDGDPWHGRLAGSDEKDERRDDDLQSKGWTVLRFRSLEAKANPAGIAESVMRIAMNHGGEYLFGSVRVEQINRRDVKGRRLYNFGVDEDESYIIRGGLVVHNCRGRWLVHPSVGTPPGGDPEFTAWLRETLERGRDQLS